MDVSDVMDQEAQGCFWADIREEALFRRPALQDEDAGRDGVDHINVRRANGIVPIARLLERNVRIMEDEMVGIVLFELEHLRGLIPPAFDLIGPDRGGGKGLIAQQGVDVRGGGRAGNQFIRHGANDSMALVAPAKSGGRGAAGEKRNDDSIKRFHIHPI